jgi:hypothetical protein
LYPNSDKIETAVNKLAEVAMHIGSAAMSPKVLNAFAFAHPFLEVSGDVIMAWMLLWRASVAAKKLEQGARKKEVGFYNGQLKSAEFFANSILPVTLGKMDAIMITNGAAVEIAEDAFGG